MYMLALFVLLIFLAAALGALVVIGVAFYRSRRPKKNEILTENQAVEVTSTWTTLHH